MKTMICLEHTAYSQYNYEIVNEVNGYVVENKDEVSICAMDQTMHFMNIDTAIFHASELDSFNNGVIIAGTINNAQEILSCANDSKKVLYLYDLDWMYDPFSYDNLYDTLTDENLTIVLRSEDHVKPLMNLCGRKPNAVIDNFKLEKIWNLL